ncbi:MAG: type I methionyl aminopeptidase [Actinomycetota bacterium]
MRNRGRRRTNDACWCGSGRKLKRCHLDTARLRRPRVPLGAVSPVRPVPAHIPRPDYVESGRVGTPTGFQVHDRASLAAMRRAGAVAAEVLLRAGAHVAEGVTTDELDAVAHEAYVELGAYPSTLGYRGFTKSICTSVNGVICHGIPDDRPLQRRDVVNVDVTAFIDGVHGDNSATFCVGDVDPAVEALVETTREATLRGIAAVAPGAELRCVAEAVEPFAWSRGYGVIREYGGHGIGRTFHAAPHVDHGLQAPSTVVLVPGMTFTVEPMLVAGRATFRQAADGWTERVDDDLPSAQFEHTVAVTETGVEILTVTAAGETAVGTLEDLASV